VGEKWFRNHTRKFRIREIMNTSEIFPGFDDGFPNLNQFILELVEDYKEGKIKSWDDLEEKVNTYFTPLWMEQMESMVPGWQKMASYTDGITLVHVMCVFLGLFMLPEFQSLTPNQKQMAKWIVLFHDIDKIHIRGKKDPMHAFRSGVQAAKALRRFGFPTSPKYEEIINSWSEYTIQAFLTDDASTVPTPDNRKLPVILAGIDQLYGENTPASLIIKTVLLHISLPVDPFYHTPAPLTQDETKRFIDPNLLPLLRVMMLADNEGWSLFELKTRARQRNDMLEAFEQVEKLISSALNISTVGKQL
jgi:hypothetical protein